ncbi:DNA-directed RNA polymerase beta subunit [Enterococcus faecium]|nr:DNA-directed RNA polymerase beta subunit [Enterococcus faecium]
MSYGENYQDRGMVKWAGFYLSEHTDTLQDQKKTESNRPVQKMQMDVDEIGEVYLKQC